MVFQCYTSRVDRALLLSDMLPQCSFTALDPVHLLLVEFAAIVMYCRAEPTIYTSGIIPFCGGIGGLQIRLDSSYRKPQ